MNDPGAYCKHCDRMFPPEDTVCTLCHSRLHLRDDLPPLPTDTSKGSIQDGIVLLCMLHFLQVLLLALGPVALLFVGITQFAYVIPAAVVLALKGRPKTVGGVLIGAGFTFLINATIFGILCAGISGGRFY